MSSVDSSASPVTIHAENIGGITETHVEIPPGVTVLTGRNATNRTSFLQSIMAVLGSRDVTLKGDAEEGRVELTINGENYYRQLRRVNGSVRFGGEPYLDEPTLAELFAFLLESNEARQTVVQQRNLRELIMEPVDTEEIQAAIEALESERDEIDEQLDELVTLKEELPELEQRKHELDGEIETHREELAALETDLESMEADVDESREEKEELESKLQELRELRGELESVRSDIDIQQESIESLRRDLVELKSEREELPEAPMGEREEIDERLTRLRERKQRLESEVSDLQDIIQFNRQMLDGEETAVSAALGSDDNSTGGLTDQLIDDESTVCWTCGSEVSRKRIEETVETIRDVRQEQTSGVREIESDIDELRDEKRERESQQRRRDSLEDEISEIEAEVDRRESRLESLRTQRDQLNDEVAAVEAEVDALESEDFSDVLDLHREANQLEFELGKLESDHEGVSERITRIERRLDAEDELTERREQIADELQAQRTRIDRIERQAIEEFNSRMDEILEMLSYDNLARIWIERVQETDTGGRQSDEQTVFELHVVRTTESGATYEDTIAHLSESEREVTGLTFALAGYLVHDVHETVPFMLLDSLEAIDSNRLADLVGYFAQYSQYLVVALLPEDAQALSEEYTRITEI